MPDERCRIEGCSRVPDHYRDLCTRHYHQLRKHGRVLTTYLDASLGERFWAQVEMAQEGGCWPWRGQINKDGYGHFAFAGRKYRAHRVAYQLMVGPIPAERPQLDHLCRNRACCNPTHLEPVTNRENSLRGHVGRRSWRRERTACKHGHPFTEDNVYLYLDKRTNTLKRYCRACYRMADRARKARLKEARNG